VSNIDDVLLTSRKHVVDVAGAAHGQPCRGRPPGAPGAGRKSCAVPCRASLAVILADGNRGMFVVSIDGPNGGAGRLLRVHRIVDACEQGCLALVHEVIEQREGSNIVNVAVQIRVEDNWDGAGRLRVGLGEILDSKCSCNWSDAVFRKLHGGFRLRARRRIGFALYRSIASHLFDILLVANCSADIFASVGKDAVEHAIGKIDAPGEIVR